VVKLGRTTGRTRGVVSAIEVDRVIVGYDRGELRFDDQLEISPAGRTPFSRGGDSGSLIVDDNRRPAALLFAGNDADTTYANPLPTVLQALKVELAGQALRITTAAKARARTLFRQAREVAGIGVTSRAWASGAQGELHARAARKGGAAEGGARDAGGRRRHRER
jgi:hypothetical protein